MKRLLLIIGLLSLPLLAQEVIFDDGFENHDPVITTSPTTSGALGETYTYDLDAEDIDGDTLLYLLAESPAGMTMDPTTGLIEWTPGNGGIVDVAVDVSDGQGGSAQQAWSINVSEGPDSDEDGLSDSAEERQGTDPNDPDSDMDLLTDGEEVLTLGTDPLASDSDRDGLMDGAEVIVHTTDPLEVDTDGDFFGDGFELQAGTDPLNPGDYPAGPPDPEVLAPGNDTTVATNLFSSVEFMFSGNPPIQTGVAENAIDPRRAAVIRGLVMTRDGAPLPGVTITIHGHPELGMTSSRFDGMFDMVVNGGGMVAVDYFATGYLPGQRQFQVPWQEWTLAPDVALVPLDSQMTPVDLEAPGMKVAQGSVVVDDDGARQAIVLFPEGVTATLTLPGGGVQPLNSLNVRATEYTVGDLGPEAMPGLLPPASGYTYAVELSADEALASAGRVDFSSPVPFYVDNFLDFPTGTIVPVGYYDRESLAWVPEPNGKVIDIVGVTGLLADIDTDGDTLADDPAVLAALGITEAERQSLAATYAPGTSLWRVPIEHFTPFDCNWPFIPPDDAERPAPWTRSEIRDLDNLTCGEAPGSVVDCQSQVLGERLPVTGTPYTLNYSSRRTPGRTSANRATVGVSGDSVPPSLQRIDVIYTIAGKREKVELDPLTNQVLSIEWDGRDALNREVYGAAELAGEVQFVYQGMYVSPAIYDASFAAFGTDELVSGQTRGEISVTAPFGSLVGTWDARAQGLGGWTLDVHHAYEFESQTLHLGSGRSRSAAAIGTVARRVVAVNNNEEYETVQGAAAIAANGDVIFLNGPQTSGYRRSADGTVDRVLGCNHFVDDPCELVADGLVATEAEFDTDGFGALVINALAMGPDDTLYLAGLCYVAQIDRQGILRLLGGSFTNNCPSESGDGGPATAATFYDIRDIDVGEDGTIYIVQGNHVVRRIGSDGVVTRLAGTGSAGYGGDGGMAANAQLRNPRRVAVGPDGTIFIADSWNFRIRAIGSDGTIQTVIGNGTPGYSGDGGPASDAQISDVGVLAVSADGRIAFAEWGGNVSGGIDGPHSCRLRGVDATGTVVLIGGDGDCISVDGWPSAVPEGVLARDLNWDILYDLDFGPDGEIYFLPGGELWKLTSALPQYHTESVAIASEQGNELYVFDGFGRHLQTLNALTGSVLYDFSYDGNGWLSGVTDGDGKVTSIERDGSGLPTAIVSPFGQQTVLSTSPYGFLASVSNPAGETFSILPTPTGLIKQTTDPRGRISTYGYDSGGRLTSQSDNAGYSQSLTRSDAQADFTVVRTTGLGRSVTFDVGLPPGGERNQVVTAPDGSFQAVQQDIGLGISASDSATGMTSAVEMSADPRFGMQAPLTASVEVAAPGGPTLTASNTSAAVLNNPNEPLSLVSLTGTGTFDGRTTTSTYDAASRTFVTTSPEGRVETTTMDEQGRITFYQYGDLASLTASYNALGQLGTLISGTGPEARTTIFAYGANGFRDSVTDPLGRTASYMLDSAGRITIKTLPGGIDIHFGYDAAGDLNGVTPPGQPEHTFTYTLHGLPESITPPAVPGSGPTSYSYNDDRQLLSITRPDAEWVTFEYDAQGRVQSIELFEGGMSAATYSYTYGLGNQIQSVVGPGAQTIDFNYQGDLEIGITWGGEVAGTFERSYDSGFRIAAETVNGGTPVSFGYDDDDLLTSAGNFSIARAAVNGLAENASLGVVADAWTYNGFGEVVSSSVSADAVPVFGATYTRDDAGRITQKVETIDGITDTYDYAYDLRGQLIEVQKNAVVTESYAYDDNGNRLSGSVNSITRNGSYDAQDRLLAYGDSTYEYTGAGRLLSHTATGGLVTEYDYDAVGNLRGVNLPDGTQVTYGLDGMDRRVQRSVDGVVTHQFLYDGLLPIAELDPLGNVVSQFIYGGGNVPVSMIKADVSYRLVSDAVGSVRLVVNAATGDVAQQIDYDSFGNVLTDTNPGFQPLGFAGGLYDPATGLLQFGMRDYDPQTGRWTVKDIIGFGGEDSNLYRYANNNPVNLADPTGTSGWDKALGYLDGLNTHFPKLTSPFEAMLSGVESLTDNLIGDWLDELGAYRNPNTGALSPLPPGVDPSDYSDGQFYGSCTADVLSLVTGGGAGAATRAPRLATLMDKLRKVPSLGKGIGNALSKAKEKGVEWGKKAWDEIALDANTLEKGGVRNIERIDPLAKARSKPGRK